MKRFCSLFALLALSVMVLAEPIDLEKARSIAGNFFMQRNSEGMRIAKAKGSKPRTTAQPIAVESGFNRLWVFNEGNDNGFVIIAGTDMANPVLGYCDSGAFDFENMPEGMKELLEDYNRQMNAPTNQSKPTTIEPKDREIIRPMLTTTWHQYRPLNIECPLVPGEPGQSLVGCGALVLAQIMHYYKYPEKPKMTIPAYTTGTGVNMPALPVVRFEYDKMKSNYPYVGDGQPVDNNDESLKAVTTLLKYSGCALQMNYSYFGSASVFDPQVIAKYFGYDKGAHSQMAGNFSHSLWEDMIYNELSNGRPVPYRAGGVGGQNHIFVIDGYDGRGYFHADFGSIASGQSNGYFKLGVLNDCEDQFGPVEFSGYNIYQSAVLGFQPDKGNAEATSEYSVIEKNPKLKIDEVTFYSPYATEKPVAEVHFTNIGESYENHIFLWMDGQMKGGVGVYTDPGEKGEAWICISPPEKGKHPFTLTSDWDGKDVIYKGNVEITDAPKNNLEAEYTIEGISQEWKDGVLYNDIYKAFTIHMKITNKASTPYNSFIIGRVGQIGMLADRETYIGSERGIWKRVWYVQLAPNETMDFDMILDEAVFEEGDFGYSIFFSYCKETDYTNTLWGNGYFKYFAQSKNYLGDVDGDGIINITDAMVIVDYVLGKQPSKFIFANADLDKDGTVNITDAMLIVDYLLGKQ